MSSRKELANAIRALSMDAVQKAKSGHPGAPMGMADIAEVLWRDFLNHNPNNPAWADRDRFVLSNGHGSMLIYSLLHLTGYDLPIEELKNFRQLHSKTPGHPEVGYTAGVETTTGPLGQGIANAVGMAIAEKTLAAQFNRPGHDIVDHYTNYVYARENAEENVFDTSYLKLKELRLEYSLPRHLCTKTRVFQGITLGVYATNLFCWTNFPLYDPEAGYAVGSSISRGIEAGAYPMTRTYGINLKLDF